MAGVKEIVGDRFQSSPPGRIAVEEEKPPTRRPAAERRIR